MRRRWNNFKDEQPLPFKQIIIYFGDVDKTWMGWCDGNKIVREHAKPDDLSEYLLGHTDKNIWWSYPPNHEASWPDDTAPNGYEPCRLSIERSDGGSGVAITVDNAYGVTILKAVMDDSEFGKAMTGMPYRAIRVEVPRK